ncbi:IS200/IS605 family transposase [Candidatus Roizmanbacteria bacterium CG_4_10_14_0_8_um_filter_33_9]|uniref:IS200/IS605 family transposase n=1 Tax=Candidatus Roizmanbacteria bacterium CG_4_10_14_0_8_um_filter_33_9 TaxID=1974826 RepID=A0A2M7QI25_9BACT|nr:MAG: IS200/IS605 family transposase [Candidatus Roizmanbacteria bacterium CG_4_10_14_0_8_um_filter_33_9]
MDIRLLAHTAYRCQYHIVFVTKYRHRALNPAKFRSVAERAIRSTMENINAVEMVEINIQPEHVHLVLIIPPKYSVSKVVEIIKSRSAKIIRKEIQWLEKLYDTTNSMWTVGYFVSTVGIDEGVVRRYVKYQQEQDSGQAELELFR